MEWLLAYLALGLVTGVIAGLLGVGGGLVMVPVLTWAYAQQGFTADFNIHLALGTSLAVIVPTAVSSMRAHHAHGAVDWLLVRRITPGILLGTLLGGGMAVLMPDRNLKLFFIAFLLYAATQMLLGFRPKPQRGLPGPAGMTLAGSIIGLVSSWVGIGGGTMSVPFQTWCNVGLHRAIGTSAAIGLPIALAGMAGYMLSGQAAAGLPLEPGLRLPARLPGHCLGQRPDCAPGGQAGPPPAGGKAEEDFRRPAVPAGGTDDL